MESHALPRETSVVNNTYVDSLVQLCVARILSLFSLYGVSLSGHRCPHLSAGIRSKDA